MLNSSDLGKTALCMTAPFGNISNIKLNMRRCTSIFHRPKWHKSVSHDMMGERTLVSRWVFMEFCILREALLH